MKEDQKDIPLDLRTLYKVDSKGKVRTFSIELDGDRYRAITGVLDGAQVVTEWTVAKPKNIGRSNATTAEEQAKAEVDAKYQKKLDKDYFDSIEAAQKGDVSIFFPMLAETLEDENLEEFLKAIFSKGGYIILDPKLDGMRWVKFKLNGHSRSGKQVPAVNWLSEIVQSYFDEYPNYILDGELYSHDYKDQFDELMSLCRKQNPDEEQLKVIKNAIKYYIYDVIDTETPKTAAERKLLLDTLKGRSDFPIELVYGKKVYSLDEFYTEKARNLDLGYEGSIIRIPDSFYENKKSKGLIKVKDFITEEFTIMDILPGKGNSSNMAGTVVVSVDGKEVGCGIRMNAENKKRLLESATKLIGKVATIRFFEYTKDGSLRFPVCIDVDRWNFE